MIHNSNELQGREIYAARILSLRTAKGDEIRKASPGEYLGKVSITYSDGGTWWKLNSDAKVWVAIGNNYSIYDGNVFYVEYTDDSFSFEGNEPVVLTTQAVEDVKSEGPRPITDPDLQGGINAAVSSAKSMFDGLDDALKPLVKAVVIIGSIIGGIFLINLLTKNK